MLNEAGDVDAFTQAASSLCPDAWQHLLTAKDSAPRLQDEDSISRVMNAMHAVCGTHGGYQAAAS